MKALLSRLRPGDGALDIGANVGSVALAMADAVGASGHVLAVEPNPEAATACRRAAAKRPVVFVREMAADATPGTVPLHCGAATVHSSFAADNVPTPTHVVEVAAETLDTFAAAVPRLAAIKIDAQGAEGRILDGARATLDRPGLLWVIEIWPEGLRACGSSVATVVTAFASRGYHVLATGKFLNEPACSWEALTALAESWTGQRHTNVLIGREA